MSGITNSILVSLKQTLWPEVEAGTNMPFDAELIMHINSIFTDLNQLGIGPDTPYQITGETETWTDFFSDIAKVNNVKSYMYLRLRMLFDPPQNSFLVQSYEKQIKEMEWRLTVSSNELGGYT